MTTHDVSHAERLKFRASSETSSTPRVQEVADDERNAAARLKFSVSNAERLKFGGNIDGSDVEIGPCSNHSESESSDDLSSSAMSRSRSLRSAGVSQSRTSGTHNGGTDEIGNQMPHNEEAYSTTTEPIRENFNRRAEERSVSFVEGTNRNSRPAERSASFTEKRNSIRRKDREAKEDGWRSLCFLSSFISFVIIIGLSIGFSNAARGSKSRVAPAPVVITGNPPSASPTTTPTKPLEEFAWCYESHESTALSEPPYAKIRSALVSSGISTEEEFSNDASYQRKALCWLAFGDRKDLDASDPFLEQRYALAAIFYRFDEPNKLSEDGWLSGKSECDWKPSVECDTRTKTTTVRLQLSGNNFFGSLPKEIAFLHDMTHIDLSVNQFDEDVSGVIGGLIHLKELKLSSNRFTTLPSALVAWKDLNHFDISDNELDGTIPESLALSNQLIYLDLALNELQGTIPVTFGNLTSLETLYIHGNQLEGSVPESVCALRSGALAILSVDCELPTVECDCCTDCDNYNPDIYPIG